MFAGPQNRRPRSVSLAFAGCFAARSSARSSVFTLKRREHARGSNVRRSCSCFRLLADSGRWRSDRCKRGRLRLSTRARSNSRPFVGCSSDGAPGTCFDRKVGASFASFSELACRLKALRVVTAAALHGATDERSWRCGVRSYLELAAHGDEASEVSRKDGRGAEQARGCPHAANQSASRRREPRGASTPVGQHPAGLDRYRTHGYSSLTIGFAVVSRTHLPACAPEMSQRSVAQWSARCCCRSIAKQAVRKGAGGPHGTEIRFTRLVRIRVNSPDDLQA